MKKRIPIIVSLLITAIIIIGCVKKIEKVTTVLNGRVIEETSMLPLNNVNVVVTNGIMDYVNVHTGVTGTFKLNVNFDDLSDGYYLYLDDGSHTKKLELKGIGKVSYDYKDIALYNNGGGASTPTVSTSTPTNITSNSATCGGNVTNDGGANVIQRGVCYSTSQNPNTSNGTIVTSGTGTGEYTCNLTGLASNTKYYVRAYAINSVGTSYGTQKDFTTSSGGGGSTSPTVTINEPSNITSTTATCGGNVTSEGSASVTERGICYNTSGTPTTSSNKVTSGSGSGAFTCNLTGLTQNTKYYVRAYAKSSAGTSYSSQKEFTTSSGGGGSTITEFTEGFESGLPSTWATIDADGDGYNWYRDYSGHNGSLGFMTSESYKSTALYPDNYMVTPRVKATANSTFSFWARAGHTSWPNEHFGVFVSTSSQTNASSFVKIQEWTMTAKGSDASNVSRDGQTRTPGTWYRYTVNLGSYANQNLYIAIRHFDCSDEYCLDVDDVELSTSGGGGGGGSNTTPTVTTSTPSNVTTNSATCGGNVTSDGGAAVTARGVCWSTSQNPTISGSHTTDGTGTGLFTSNITGLADNTTYYVRAYAINSEGTAYGTEQQFTTSSGGGGGTVTTTWSDSFEDGYLINWDIIDSDGDGQNWMAIMPTVISAGNAHGGSYCASSWSWDNVSYDPDNYMISPLCQNAISIRYYVATHVDYPDHYAVMVSYTGTNISDFTVVFEETAPVSKHKSNGNKTNMTQNNNTRDMSPWTERNINLPSGTKYVAFRHYNSYDMNYIFIDDVTITMEN